MSRTPVAAQPEDDEMGKNRCPTESEWLDLIAYHEAGHAVAALIGGLSVECGGSSASRGAVT